MIDKRFYWGRSPFIFPPDYRQGAIESKYDAQLPEARFLRNGAITEDIKIESIKQIDYSPSLSLICVDAKPGPYSIAGEKRRLFPSSVNHQVIETTTETILAPLMTQLPVVAIYRRETDIIKIKQQWAFAHVFTTGKQWKLTGTTVTLSENTGLSFTSEVIDASAVVSLGGVTYYRFDLPAFPFAGVTIETVGVGNYLMDPFMGYIYITTVQEFATITVSYTAYPMISYTPQNHYYMNDTIIDIIQPTANKFICLSPNRSDMTPN